jgi:hypothetical protein
VGGDGWSTSAAWVDLDRDLFGYGSRQRRQLVIVYRGAHSAPTASFYDQKRCTDPCATAI